MTLSELLSVIKSKKPITINLYDENDLLLISFGHLGYIHLDDDLENRKIQEIEIINLTNINIKLAEAQSNETPVQDEDTNING